MIGNNADIVWRHRWSYDGRRLCPILSKHIVNAPRRNVWKQWYRLMTVLAATIWNSPRFTEHGQI